MSANSIVDFRDLEAWQAAMDLAATAHELAAALPPVQKYELASQLRRAATSVPGNVAEGQQPGAHERFCVMFALRSGRSQRYEHSSSGR